MGVFRAKTMRLDEECLLEVLTIMVILRTQTKLMTPSLQILGSGEVGVVVEVAVAVMTTHIVTVQLHSQVQARERRRRTNNGAVRSAHITIRGCTRFVKCARTPNRQ